MNAPIGNGLIPGFNKSIGATPKSKLKVLPEWGGGDSLTTGNGSKESIPSRDNINGSANDAEDRQLTVAAENSIIPVTYGRDRCGAKVANIVPNGANWVVQVVWGEGPIDAIESMTLKDEPVPASVPVTHYLGTLSQTVDPTLVSAFSEMGITYSDSLPGIAYSVLVVPNTEQINIEAIIRGRKLYDPRTGLTTYSNNPALALADFLTDTTYGAGRPVNWASVSTLANLCDTMIGVEKSRTIDLTLENSQDVDNWIETLRVYAGCFVVQRDDGYHLIPDTTGAAVRHYSHDAGNLLNLGPLRKRPIYDAPTVMILRYTNTSKLPWRDDRVVVQHPGVNSGSVPRRESEVRLPGIQSASFATREAIKRLNLLGLSDLSTTAEVFDDGVEIEVGDIVEISHPVGLAAKQFRVTKVDAQDAGRYSLELNEYDPAAYSGAVVTTPTYPDTNLPDAGSPIPPTGVTATEEVYQMQNGTFASRIRLNWVAPDFPFISSYRIAILNGPTTVFTGTAGANSTTWASPAVQEGINYQIDIHTISMRGNESSAASTSLLTQGKNLVPGDVPWLSAFEVGGEVRLQWGAAVDIDIWRYEIRYGAIGTSWSAGTVVDRVDALGTINKQIPAGDWDIMVKAVDSVGNYSANEARRTVQVTVDDNAFLAEFYQYDTPTLTNMVQYRTGRIDRATRWVTTNGASWDSTYTAALNSYTNPILSYQGANGQLLTEVNDYGLALSGNWNSEASVQVLSGTYADQMELSDDAVTWDVYTDMAAKRTARHSRLRITNTSGVIIVSSPDLYTRIDAVPRTESGTSMSMVSGPKKITLVGEYSFAKTITITPTGTSSRVGVVDNVVPGSPTTFDVYIFDSLGNQVANSFFWQFDGV